MARAVVGSEGFFNKISFAEDPETALMLVLPNLRHCKFTRLKFQIWKLKLGLATKVLTPLQASRRYGLPFAFKHGEWISLRNQRLEKAGEVTIDSSTPFEDIVETINGVETVVCRKYLFKN